MSDKSLFQSVDLDQIVVITPVRNMGEFEVSESDVPVYDRLIEIIKGRNVVIDFSKTDYFGSSTIGLFNRLIQHMHGLNRKVAFCNFSPHEKEVIEVTHVDSFWDVKPSLQAAIKAVAEQ